MIIEKGERTPEYFGCIARMNKVHSGMNPYAKDDPRRIRWQDGFSSGELEQEGMGEK